jgi:hypothetical protein
MKEVLLLALYKNKTGGIDGHAQICLTSFEEKRK